MTPVKFAPPETLHEPPRFDREALRRTLSLFAVILGLFLIPILAHGCHGPDADLEPSNQPPEARP